jgi:pimeloyl-ACP methyl ester carboxylesterase
VTAKVLVFLLFLAVLSSCVPAARVPVGVITYPYEKKQRQKCLVVFFPGRGDGAGDFASEGFIKSLHQSGIRADAVAVDLHIGYYMNRTAIERLRLDVIAPAQKGGYVSLWVVAISLGGLASLEYERKYRGELSGIVLLGPYLGDDDIIEEIIRSGGLQEWEPGYISDSDFGRRLWAWLRHYKDHGNGNPIIYLGYGNEDRYEASDRLLTTVIGPDRVITVPGGHSWYTWRILWENMVKKISCRDEALTGVK